MEKRITLNAGECEIITRLATKALSEGDLERLEERDAHSVRQKIVKSETVATI